VAERAPGDPRRGTRGRQTDRSPLRGGPDDTQPDASRRSGATRRPGGRRAAEIPSPAALADDPTTLEPSVLQLLGTASVQGRIALGPNAGAYVPRLGRGSLDGAGEFERGKLCADVEGFSLDAEVCIPGYARERRMKPGADRRRPLEAGATRRGWIGSVTGQGPDRSAVPPMPPTQLTRGDRDGQQQAGQRSTVAHGGSAPEDAAPASIHESADVASRIAGGTPLPPRTRAAAARRHPAVGDRERPQPGVARERLAVERAGVQARIRRDRQRPVPGGSRVGRRQRELAAGRQLAVEHADRADSERQARACPRRLVLARIMHDQERDGGSQCLRGARRVFPDSPQLVRG
jgi:hypothetical protein